MNSFARKRRILKIFKLMMAFYQPRVYRPILFLSVVIALISCTNSSDNDNPPPGTAPSSLGALQEREVSENRTVDFEFDLGGEIAAFQLVARNENEQLRLVEIEDPEGNLVFDSTRALDNRLSGAGSLQNSPVTYNYPQLSSQPLLVPGTYRARFELEPAEFNSDSDEVIISSVSLDLLTKSDGDLLTGTVNVNAVLSASAAGSRNIRDAVEEAFRISQKMLSRFGVQLHIEFFNLPELPETLPDPMAGDLLFEELAAATEGGINIYIASSVPSLGGQREYVSAIEGASPGALIPSPRSAIVVDINRAAGEDGLFDHSDEEDDSDIDDSEVRLLAENVTHSLLSYLGLSDTVNFSGSTVASSDALDSEKCTSLDACQENKGANGNLMFPFPLEDEDSDQDKFFPRDRLSPQQIELLQRSVALD
ncbi:MAG: hypothetical protein J5J00_13760 [Deltaproteobacteria bacterium]|nr:hypothetical protein [Deltaproteobacteria bacterium]